MKHSSEPVNNLSNIGVTPVPSLHSSVDWFSDISCARLLAFVAIWPWTAIIGTFLYHSAVVIYDNDVLYISTPMWGDAKQRQ